MTLIYDPSRGGFVLEFCHLMPPAPHFNLFDGIMGTHISTGGIMGAHITNDLLVVCVDSIWDRGGLLLNSLYYKPNDRHWQLERKREISLGEGLTRSDSILVRQTPKEFEIWFGSAPLSQPPTASHSHDSKTLLSVWLAAEPVTHPYLDPSHPYHDKFKKPVLLGMRLQFSHLAAKYPLNSLAVWTEDIK